MNIAFAEPDPELAEISAAARTMLDRLGGLQIARGLLDGDDGAAKAADAALLDFGLLELAAGDDVAASAPLRQLAVVTGVLGSCVLAARYVPRLASAHLASVLGLEPQRGWAGTVAFWDSPSADLAWARNAHRLNVHYAGPSAVAEGLLEALAGDLSGGAVYIPVEVDGDNLLLALDLAGAGVDIRVRPTLSPTLQLADLHLRDAPCTVVARGETARAALRGAHRLAACALATAQAQGAAEIARIAAAYAKERFQFGQPIGSFQAIKHRCADMYIEAQLARAMADAAAADAANPDAPHAAKAFCGEAYRFVATKAVQIHGGIGITWEHAAHLYLRDAHATATLLGGAAAHRRILAGRAASAAAREAA